MKVVVGAAAAALVFRQQWWQQCRKLQIFMWNGLVQCKFTCTFSCVSCLFTHTVL